MQNLTAYEYLDRDLILKGVANWLVKESPMLGAMPMKSIQGNAYKYNVSLTLPTASWLTVGDQIPESTGTYEQRSTDIYTMIQNAYTDKAAIALNATQNPEAIDAELAAQAMAHEWEKTLIIGQTSTQSNSKQFKGLLRTIAEFETSTTTDLDGAAPGAEGNNSQVLAGGATNATMTMAMIDELIDKIKPGKPDVLLMSRLSRRRLDALQRAAGNAGMVMTDSELFGKMMTSYDGIPIYISDFLPDNFPDASSSVTTISTYNYDAAKSAGSNLDNSFIFAMKLGEKNVQGLNSGEMKHEREEFVEDYNAICNRYVWYTGLMCASKYSLAVLTSLVA
uniref:Putative capsid protein n=1 Tax=viral metagenome TaxID=1070528 RepID=A0A6M3IJ10_9ZZZZ